MICSPFISLFDVRQLPRLIEERLLGTIETKERFELSVRPGRDPVRFFSVRRLRREVDIDRAIGIFLQTFCLRRTTRPLGVANQAMRGAIIGGHRPVLFNRHVRRDVETIGIRTVESIPVLVPDGEEVVLARSQMLGTKEGIGISYAAASVGYRLVSAK